MLRPCGRVFPVGRLDRDSSGLVLLTDDGRVPEALLDPARKAPKLYEAWPWPHVDLRTLFPLSTSTSAPFVG